MKKSHLVVAALVLLIAGALRAAGEPSFWRRYWHSWTNGGAESAAQLLHPRVRLAGIGGELPRATAEAELMAPEALAAATDEARRQGVRALIVHRHGHRLLEVFADNPARTAQVSGGELAGALLALSAGVLVDTRRVTPDAALQAVRDASHPGERWINPWSPGAQHRFRLAPPPALLSQDAEDTLANTVARRVWQPIGASDAWLWGTGDNLLRVDCCAVAHLDDWMRLGDLLLQQGSYQGERIVSAEWIRQLLAADKDEHRHPVWLGPQWTWLGDEPPAARDTFWFDLGRDLRLWLSPRRGVSVLVWVGKGDARDTLIPNIVLRGVLDQLPSIGGSDNLDDLVPGHSTH
jgi:hypothetical protein